MTPTPPEQSLRRSARAVRYGIAITVVLAGVACGLVIPSTVGGTICTVLVGIGLVGVVSLVFYDVGLTEDRDRARSGPRSADGSPLPEDGGGGASRQGPASHEPLGRHRPPDRMRGRRRRLR